MDTQEHSACTALKDLQSHVQDRDQLVDANLVDLQTQILNATTETTLGQQSLQLKIDNQATSLATETSERKANVELLQANISGVQTAIQTEVSNRQEAITGIRSELTTLQTSVPLTVQAAVDKLIDGAPEALDTLKEISAWIESHDGETGVVASLNAMIAQAEANAKNLANATGTLTVSHGGTGATTAKEAEYNLLNAIPVSDVAFSDDDSFACVKSTPTTADGVLVKKKASLFWTYIQNKISSVLGLTKDTYSGKASTAGTADTAKALSAAYLVSGTQTTTSTADGGSNVYTFTDSKGNTSTLTVKNGSKGSTGAQGPAGTNATTTAVATTSSNGLMSAADKTKLNSITIV